MPGVNKGLFDHLGQVGYEAYAVSTGGKTFDGRDMPAWADLPDRIRLAWNAAASAVLIELERCRGGGTT